MKKKEIQFEEFAKLVSVDPQKYMDDTVKLAAKIKVYLLLYGDLGLKGLVHFLEQV